MFKDTMPSRPAEPVTQTGKPCPRCGKALQASPGAPGALFCPEGHVTFTQVPNG